MSNAAILSIGTELTRGELTNTNATWLADQLTTLGFDVIEHVTVADDRAAIADVLKRLSTVARVVVSTGGLGPTSDDLTAECVATALGVRLQRDLPSLERIRHLFAKLGRTMPRSNEKQADVPTGATVLPNDVGTAPGFAVDFGAARMFFMPGVPFEMKHIFAERVERELRAFDLNPGGAVYLHCFGIPESEAGETLADLEADGITLGYRAHFPEVEVKVLCQGCEGRDAQSLARQTADEVRRRLGSRCYGEGDDTFSAVVGRSLRRNGYTLALAESCTGGLAGKMLTDVPGSSEFLLFDGVVYANSAKQQVLGVSPETLRAYGAVSGECATAMAAGALRLSGADFSVAITGIAGPGGATDEKPIGTVWFALVRRKGGSIVEHKRLPGDRERIRTMAAYLALNYVRRAAEHEI